MGVESFDYKLLKTEYNDNKRVLLGAEIIESCRPTLNTSWGFGRLKYPISTYKNILAYKSTNLNYKLKEVCAAFPEVNCRVVSDIINLRKYPWLKEVMPEEYGRVLDHLLY